MTSAWDALIASNGRTSGVDYSLEIEGCPSIFCTGGMVYGALADGRECVPGLRRDGLGFAENVYIAGAEHDSSIGTCKIDEGAYVPGYRGRATLAFSRIARVVGYLTATLTVGSATADVNDSTAFPDGVYHIGTEVISVTARPTGTTVSIVRGRWGTTAQEHPVLSADERANVVPLYSSIPGYRKRRAWLRAHTVNELGLGDAGTDIWRGIVSAAPSCGSADAGLLWSIPFSSRTALLDGSLAGGWDAGFALRGIYYPGAAPLRIDLYRHPGATYAYSSPGTQVTFEISGFWEDQPTFAADLAATLNTDATVVSWGVLYEVRIDDDGTWQLWYRTASASPRFCSAWGGSNVDGFFATGLQDEAFYASWVAGGVLDFDAPGLRLDVVASTWYRFPRLALPTPTGVPYAEQRRTPRSNNARGLRFSGSVDSAIAAYPVGRIYVNRVASLTTADAITFVPQTTPRGGPYDDTYVDSAGEIRTAEADTQSCAITAVDSGDNFLELTDGGDHPRICAAGAYQPALEAAVVFAGGSGSLSDFRSDLITRAPATANRGQSPWVTADDLESWAVAVAEQADGRPFLEARAYVFSKSVKAIEVLREEWKLYRLIPYLTAAGKLAVRPLILDDGEPVATLGPDTHVVDDGPGSVGGEADGLCTVVEVMTGYDPIEDEHVGGTFRFRNLSAIQRLKDEIVISIEPKSKAVGADLTYEDVVQIALPVTTLFGARSTQVVEARATLSMFYTLIGDHIQVSIPELPADGDRGSWTLGAGMTERSGLVIGRDWDLATGAGTLRILLHELAVAGYTPSGFIVSASGATTAWVLTLDPVRYSTANDAAKFRVGDSIRMREYDVDVPSAREGEITAIAGNDISVTFSASWTGMGSSDWWLYYDTSNDSQTKDSQLEYAFIANPTQRIALLASTKNADEFSI